MRCPKCSNSDAKVIESREVSGGESIRRRRECLSCSNRYTTYERIERPNLIVVKKDGTRELFDRKKILAGLDRACQKTPVTALQREEVVAAVENQVYSLDQDEVDSKYIGELIMEQLADLNDVAYVRFASVYRHFKSVQGFERELAKLKSRSG
jgi:transcriptional repressor NrdR